MEELRIEIWDILFRAKEPKTIGQLAQLTGRDEDSIRAAVDHEWFTITRDVVTISQSG